MECGCKSVSVYAGRGRLVRGLSNGNIPTVIHVTSHRTYCPDCGKRHQESFPFLSHAKSRVTKGSPPSGLTKGSDALAGFVKRIHRWRRRIKCVCMDMSNACAKWVRECLPDAQVVHDRFHVIKAMDDRLDAVRRRTMDEMESDIIPIAGWPADFMRGHTGLPHAARVKAT